MFIKKTLPNKNKKEKVFEFDIFKMQQNTEDDPSILKEGETKICYNFISQEGNLKSGYGFKELVSPIDEVNLNDEYTFEVHGDEVSKMWKLKWYDINTNTNCHYLFYYNNENQVCFDDLFKTREDFFFFPTDFTSQPFITNYKYNKEDVILLSSAEKTMIVSGSNLHETVKAPAIISCCDHYGKLFAITAEARGALVYTETDVINWDDTLTKNLDFTDERGDLNKIISFNDYLYVFRDFGITQISMYASGQTFSINHMYKACNYIHPNTIVEYGDKIYFMEGNNLKEFNGNSVKDIDIKCINLLNGEDNRNINAEIFDGKYFLACRANFKDEHKIGCENSQNGYKNNLLLVYDILSKQVDLFRGVDVRQLLALTNNIKSKLVACFYNDNKAKIGQLIFNGNVFGEKLSNNWSSGKLDFDMPGEKKRMKSFSICAMSDCVVSVKSEEGIKDFYVNGKESQQRILVNHIGKNFEIEITSASEEGDYISNFVVKVEKCV